MIFSLQGMLNQFTIIALLLGVYGILSLAVETNEAIEQEDKRSGCPPGYWCKRKREFDSAECPRGFVCRSKRSMSSEVCPPGYWCRRSELVVDHAIEPEDCQEK